VTRPSDRREVLRYLALRAGWFVLHVFHHHGLGPPAEAMGHSGGAGCDADEVFRRETESGGRCLRYREGSFDARSQRIALRGV
jgi:hypothetical protein